MVSLGLNELYASGLVQLVMTSQSLGEVLSAQLRVCIDLLDGPCPAVNLQPNVRGAPLWRVQCGLLYEQQASR